MQSVNNNQKSVNMQNNAIEEQSMVSHVTQNKYSKENIINEVLQRLNLEVGHISQARGGQQNSDLERDQNQIQEEQRSIITNVIEQIGREQILNSQKSQRSYAEVNEVQAASMHDNGFNRDVVSNISLTSTSQNKDNTANNFLIEPPTQTTKKFSQKTVDIHNNRQ